jgi:rhodanese-related sulfurtransferase
MQQIEVQELAALLADPANKDLQLLDVREAWEVQTAAVQPSIHISMQHIVARFNELDPTKLTVCLCHHGARSMQVAHFLERQGFDQVLNLSGGIDAWSRQIDPSIATY